MGRRKSGGDWGALFVPSALSWQEEEGVMMDECDEWITMGMNEERLVDYDGWEWFAMVG